LDEEKSKYAGLAQEFGFGSTLLHHMLWLVKRYIMLKRV
jgi:hypothetical protein